MKKRMSYLLVLAMLLSIVAIPTTKAQAADQVVWQRNENGITVQFLKVKPDSYKDGWHFPITIDNQGKDVIKADTDSLAYINKINGVDIQDLYVLFNRYKDEDYAYVNAELPEPGKKSSLDIVIPQKLLKELNITKFESIEITLQLPINERVRWFGTRSLFFTTVSFTAADLQKTIKSKAVKYDADDIKVIKAFIAAQKKAGVTLNSNIYDSFTYQWVDGKLIGIDLSCESESGDYILSSDGLTYEDLPKGYEFFKKIKSIDLSGLSKLKNLTNLNVSGNKLTKLDVSKLTKLERLDCHGNQLTKLDVSKLTKLTGLYCSSNQLTSLTVNGAAKLDYLDCNANKLSKLDVSKLTKLTYLFCYDNQLTSLTVNGAANLYQLSCHINKLKKLDVSKLTKLERLFCYSNQLTSLDVSKLTKLSILSTGKNQLKALNVSKNTKLTELVFDDNQLKDIDVSKNTALTWLSFERNKLAKLDVSKLTKLSTLYANENQLKALDLSKNKNLKSLYVQSNKLTKLDVSKLTKLEILNCESNKLTSLDVSKLTNLEDWGFNYDSSVTLKGWPRE